jgi:hypothetical protein
MLDEKLKIFADLYARYMAAHETWLDDGGDPEGPWREAMDGLLGYAMTEHGIGSSLIIDAAKAVDL